MARARLPADTILRLEARLRAVIARELRRTDLHELEAPRRREEPAGVSASAAQLLGALSRVGMPQKKRKALARRAVGVRWERWRASKGTP